MSGATLTGVGRSPAYPLPDGFVPRTTFGTRMTDEARLFALSAHSVDSSVPALRRRIATTPAATRPRLPLAVGGALIAGLSAALWLNLVKASGVVFQVLAQIF